MAIKSPATYSDWYWANSVEAELEKLNQAGEDFKKFAIDPFAIEGLAEALPFGMAEKWAGIVKSPNAGLLSVGTGVFNQVTGSGVDTILSAGLRKAGYVVNRHFKDKHVTIDQACNLLFRKKIQNELFVARCDDYGYDPSEALWYYESLKPFPAAADVFRWARYNGDPQNIRATVWEKLDISGLDFDMWDFLTKQQITSEQAHTLMRRRLYNEYDFEQENLRIGWDSADINNLKEIGWLIPNPMLLIQADLHNELGDDTILADISIGDIHPEYAQKYYDSIRTKPATTDLLTYLMRIDPNLSDVDRHLRKIGIHPDYFDVYKKLAYIIPPVQDIITMAVREAFTPSIAERFGQYEDFPEDFAKYAAMKGLTEDWAKRYWAAHWSLPAPTQGFEMFQRGIITKDELNMLLRALDIMPFWREKLVQMAYRPYTRIDVGRMYQSGVLNESQVKQAYTDLGYSPEKAEAMTKFTVKQTITRLSRYSSNDVVKAYSTRIINHSEASNLLGELGLDYNQRGIVLNSAEHKKDWDYKADVIAGIKNLYKKKEYTETKAKQELYSLGLPDAQVTVLMKQWFYEVEKAGQTAWTTAQTLTFYQRGLINSDRARNELELLNYNNERINVLLQNAKYVKPAVG